jgi:predicted house-cleaning noncanonical NTP pyrophosphatase (MazG superfamily)
MNKKYFHKKLIRDKIPQYIDSIGGQYETRVMDDGEFGIELKRKLVEEANEVFIAPQEEIISELADVLQLVKSIAKHNGLSFIEVARNQAAKKKKRGTFNKKLFLIWSSGKSS